MNAFGILPNYFGIVAHDSWASYQEYGFTHKMKRCLKKHEDAVMAFSRDFNISFDNNGSEWDIRIVKVALEDLLPQLAGSELRVLPSKSSQPGYPLRFWWTWNSPYPVVRD